MDQAVVAFIRDVGFPIAVVVWLLMRFEPQLAALKKSVDRMREALKELRRAQLLYVIGHPAFKEETKQLAQKMLTEQSNVEDDPGNGQ